MTKNQEAKAAAFCVALIVAGLIILGLFLGWWGDPVLPDELRP